MVTEKASLSIVAQLVPLSTIGRWDQRCFGACPYRDLSKDWLFESALFRFWLRLDSFGSLGSSWIDVHSWVGFRHSVLSRYSAWWYLGLASLLLRSAELLVSKWPFHSRFLKFFRELGAPAFFVPLIMAEQYWCRKQNWRRQWILMSLILHGLKCGLLERTQFCRWCQLSKNKSAFFRSKDLDP